MGCLGRHLAVTEEQVERLRRVSNGEEVDEDENVDAAVWAAVQGIEERLPERYYHDTDKAWDGLHRALTADNTPDGRLSPGAGEHPLNLCVMGGEPFCEGEDYSICLIEPDQVAEVASALAEVEEAWLRKRFFTLDPRAAEYDINEDQFEYVWGNFQGLPEFFARAAAEGRAVIFTVSH